MSKKISVLAIAPLAAVPALVSARGVTPYLPLNLDPEVESQIERVLILGDKPALVRPIPAGLVIDALPKACEIDPELCERVKLYLKRYMGDTGVEFLSMEASAGTGSNPVLPNQHGQTAQSHYQVSGAGYVQFNDYMLANLGAVAYEGHQLTATGSYLSLGWDAAQLDVGYRDHWWSPMTEGSMLISTEAPTMPSITLSSYRPLTRLGIQYELFIARMSYTNQIETVPTGALTAGYPKFAGVHLSLEPVSGWSVGANRVLIFGGGAAGGQSINDVLQAFFDPAKAQTSGFGAGKPVVGKQEASVESEFIFPGRVPFSVYAEYSSNDTSDSKNWLFGKPDLSVGIHFPRIGPFDLTLESSRWAPTWYAHTFSAVQTGYEDGITNYMLSIGNWFGDQRVFNDAVGGTSQLVRVGYEPTFGGLLQAELRTLTNDSIYHVQPGVDFAYRHEYMGSLSYSYPWHGYAIGAEVDAGRDVFGARYTRLSGFLRLGDALSQGYDGSDDGGSSQRADGAELFADIGANVNRIHENIVPLLPQLTTADAYGPMVGIGARRQVSAHQDLGVELEADEIQRRLLLAFHAIDYRYRFNNPLALHAFIGAARYDLGTPAFGWYLGAGPSWRNIVPGWDVGADFRYGVKVARLRELPSDPFPMQTVQPDSFYDIYSVSVYLSRKF